MSLPVATPSLPQLPEPTLPAAIPSMPADAAAYAHGFMPGALPPGLAASGLSTSTLAVVALCALIGIAIVAFAMLKGWQGWLALKARELDLRVNAASGGNAAADTAKAPAFAHGDANGGEAMPATANLIELADLKERIRKLEAIASGVDL